MGDRAAKTDEVAIKQAATCGYNALKRIGAGTYGFVYEVSDKLGNVYAFKYMLPHTDYKSTGLSDLIEIDVLSRLDHPHILHAAHIITPFNCNINGMALVLPLADGSLYDRLRRHDMTTAMKLPILYKLACALEFMHANGVMHLDIKSTNVVMRDMHPYFIDFGVSLETQDVQTGVLEPYTRLTIDHRAPELLGEYQVKLYDGAVDVWAFGIMMLYVLSERRIYPVVDFSTIKPSELKTVVLETFKDDDRLEELLVVVDNKYEEQCMDLFHGMLALNPDARFTAKQIVDHPLFDEVREPITGTVISPPIAFTYAADQDQHVKWLIHWAKNLFPTFPCEILFLAVDLLNRMGSYLANAKPEQRTILAATCLMVAIKVIKPDDAPTFRKYVKSLYDQDTIVSVEELLETETEIVAYLNGVLNVNSLFKQCENGNQLIATLQYVILSPDSTLYARVDIPAWTEFMKTIIDPTIPILPKTITCDELFVN